MEENKTQFNDLESKPVETKIVPENDLIDYDTFSKVQLRVATVVTAERVEKSEKLLKLKVSLGSDLGEKQILAGIAKHYSPEDLIGKNIVVVANLKPAKLMGLESQGMLLAASNAENKLEILSVNQELTAGSIVR